MTHIEGNSKIFHKCHLKVNYYKFRRKRSVKESYFWNNSEIAVNRDVIIGIQSARFEWVCDKGGFLFLCKRE